MNKEKRAAVLNIVLCFSQSSPTESLEGKMMIKIMHEVFERVWTMLYPVWRGDTTAGGPPTQKTRSFIASRPHWGSTWGASRLPGKWKTTEPPTPLVSKLNNRWQAAGPKRLSFFTPSSYAD